MEEAYFQELLMGFLSKKTTVVRNVFRCPVPWDSMAGVGLVKHCSECKSNVYDLSELSDDEIIDFVTLQSGSVCAKLQMTRDGKVIDGKCSEGEQIFIGRIAIVNDKEKQVRAKIKSSEKRIVQLNELLKLVKEKTKDEVRD
jgi:hypothetical protein